MNSRDIGNLRGASSNPGGWHAHCSTKVGRRTQARRDQPQIWELTQLTKQTSILHLAISGVLALSGTAYLSSAAAATEEKQQCAGIAKAGKNDCATSTNDCHGHVTSEGNPEAWIYLPKGTCERIVGGRVVHVTVPSPVD
jgi:uncharacterized membrane protein